jgi:hypothetical protein
VAPQELPPVAPDDEVDEGPGEGEEGERQGEATQGGRSWWGSTP